MHLLDDLAARGLAYQQTDADGLREHLAVSRSVYAGFDPTKPSLTVGHLLPLLLLSRFQRAGHRPVVVMGGGTALIGDPSGKSTERPLISEAEVQANIEAQRPLFERVLDFTGANAATLANNADWLLPLKFVEMLRDIGKHFSINAMLQRDSVRERLNSREQGISYTEFSYMLLQAYDFLHLYDHHGVTVQAAGSDQWGNIVAGVDLIRRTRRVETFGFTNPLLVKADGTKFGKTEKGAVWLDRSLTSPYEFYQFWLNTADAELPKYLSWFTFLTSEAIEELVRAGVENPGAREPQHALARELTQLIHGDDGLSEARTATQALFSGNVTGLSREALEDLFRHTPSSTIPRSALEGEGLPLVDFLVQAEVAKSKREARELLQSHAILVNGRPGEPEGKITTEWLLHGEVALVRRGRKTWHVVRAPA